MMASKTMTNSITAEPTLQMRLQIPQPPSKPQANSNRMKQRLRLDPSRALEPARKKIASVEAQRVMSVFEETIKKSEIVTLLPYVMNNIDRFKIVLGSELCDLLEQHRASKEGYEEIKEQLDASMKRHHADSQISRSKSATSDYVRQEDNDIDGDIQEEWPRDEFGDTEPGEDQNCFPDESRKSSRASSASSYDSQAENLMRNLGFIAQQLNFSCKNILRAFYVNPTAVSAIRAEMGHRAKDCTTFVTSLNELKDILLHKLLTTPIEEQERMSYLQEISQRERNNANVIEKLETELKSAQDDKEEEIRKKNDIIRKLQADLHQIEKFSEEHIHRVKGEAEKQEAADIKNSDGKKQKLVQDVSQLKTQLQNLVSEHRDNEQEMRRKKFKIETEVENWIQKYDQEMGQRQDEYEEIDAIYTEEKKQLNELEERFKTLEEEYEQIMEERRIAREKQEAAERALALAVKAATTIQAFWRSFKVRKALKARKKKGGKGKGKGKKK